LRKFPPAQAILGTEDVIVDVSAIDSEPLPRHPLITLMPAYAMSEKVCEDLRNRQLACVRAMSTRKQLPFDADPEYVSSLLINEMFALSITSIVGVVNHPGSSNFS
jgi:hypothetical protein